MTGFRTTELRNEQISLMKYRILSCNEFTAIQTDFLLYYDILFIIQYFKFKAG